MINWGSSFKKKHMCHLPGHHQDLEIQCDAEFQVIPFLGVSESRFKKKIQFSNFTGEFDDKTMSLGHMGAQLVVMGVFENGIYPPTMALWYVY